MLERDWEIMAKCMNRFFFALWVLSFSLLAPQVEAAAEIREDIVEALRPKLNSDRIAYFFGSYGVEPMAIESSAFPASRISNLYSVEEEKHVMRTLAFVDFVEPVHPKLSEVHDAIQRGKSLGATLREAGWTISKNPLYFGQIPLTSTLMEWMKESSISEGAIHIHQLSVSGNGCDESMAYCTIFELHNPQYLTVEWLQALYADQYAEFSQINPVIEELLSRMEMLTHEIMGPKSP